MGMTFTTSVITPLKVFDEHLGLFTRYYAFISSKFTKRFHLIHAEIRFFSRSHFSRFGPDKILSVHLSCSVMFV